jgi:hypothetical protein
VSVVGVNEFEPRRGPGVLARSAIRSAKRWRDQIFRSVVVSYDVVFQTCTKEAVPEFGGQKTKRRPIIVNGTEKVIVDGMILCRDVHLSQIEISD